MGQVSGTCFVSTYATGAFIQSRSGTRISGGGSGLYGGSNAYMDASDCNAIYGNSTTVQPPAITLRFYIKY